MEDGVTEFDEDLVPPQAINLNSKDESKREDDGVEEKESKACEKEDDIGGGGVVKNLISSLITPLSPSINGKGSYQHESVDVDDGGGGDKIEGEKGGVGDGGEGEEEEGGGGLIRKMVSNFFHQSEKNKEEEEVMDGGKIKRQKTEDAGFIHNIVSHLPDSIPDDAAPTADEATILINSLVRD